MTVEQNMGFGLRMNGHPKPEIAAKVREASRILKLNDYLARKPAALSGGQRQRVAIGRAIVRGPEVFLFDEPLSNLDAELRVEMRVEIARLHKEIGATMIYVTHDQVEAMTLATRIVVLANKGIAQVGTPLELYERPENEFVAQFIGSPAMNLLAGEVIETGAQTTVRLASGGIAVSAVPTQGADKGLKVNVGVRPEDLVETTGPALYEGTVNFTEALGEVTILYFNRVGDAAPMIGKLPGIHAGLRGRVVRLTADPAKVQLFHAGRSLYYR
jgi:alpha-glucoside transport system ATP-binding protein